MKSRVLATRASTDRHTAVNLAAEINDVVKEFGLERRIFACIHDNAANISLAGSMIDGTQDRPKAFNIGCAAHIIHWRCHEKGMPSKRWLPQPGD